jgi:hypothetical protein
MTKNMGIKKQNEDQVKLGTEVHTCNPRLRQEDGKYEVRQGRSWA